MLRTADCMQPPLISIGAGQANCLAHETITPTRGCKGVKYCFSIIIEITRDNYSTSFSNDAEMISRQQPEGDL